MAKYYTPNESQMRAAVKGADRHDFYRRRAPWLRIVLAVSFGALWVLIFLLGLMGWGLK